MQDEKARINELRDMHIQLRWETREVEGKLSKIVLRFDGTVVEALKLIWTYQA